ncbi:MAG: anti-sigma regulatory factor [Phormidesmis sp.]
MNYAAPEEKSSEVKSSAISSESPFRQSTTWNNKWQSLSFTSTLYLHPILDTLIAPTPDLLHDELRLGLQEALVNAAKHGNQLDPAKLVSVRHAKVNGYYWWIVSDQGKGFKQPDSHCCPCSAGPSDNSSDNLLVSEGGRGLYILHQVFDQVCWSEDGREVHLAKQIRHLPTIGFVATPFFLLKVLEAWRRRWLLASAN